MGDWEDLCEHHGKPNDGDSDWLIDSINSSNSMYKDYNESGRDSLDSAQKTVPGEDQLKKMVFENLQEVKAYAIQNQGHTFTKNPNGPGFIIKDANNTPHFPKKNEQGLKRQGNIRQSKLRNFTDINSGLMEGTVDFWNLISISYEKRIGHFNWEKLKQVLGRLDQHVLVSFLRPMLNAELQEAKKNLGLCRCSHPKSKCRGELWTYEITKDTLKEVEKRIQ